MLNHIKVENRDIMKSDIESQEQRVIILNGNKIYYDFLNKFFSVFIMFIIAENKFVRRLNRRMRLMMKIF